MSVVATRDGSNPVAEPARKVVDLEKLIAEERERLERLFAQPTFMEALRPRWDLDEYLRLVLELHAPIVERWGDWRWHSGPLEAVGLDEKELPRIFQAVQDEFIKKGLKLKSFDSREMAAWCEYKRCHFPMPLAHPSIFGAREYRPAIPAIKEASLEYASKQQVKIRAGQAISRAILADLNRKYKDVPEAALYLAMWNRVFERLGQSWAGGKPLGITLTIAPCDILRFGHLGETSCYTGGHTREHSKLNITMVPNSFGLFFYRELEDPAPPATQLRAAAPSGRAWGVAEFGVGGAALTNTYLENWDTVRPSVLRALRESFGFGELRGDPGKWGSLNRLGIKHNKKIFAFVNADQWVAAPVHQAEQVHLNIADQVETFVLKRTRQHGQVANCSSCGEPGEDGVDIMLCACARCAASPTEEGKHEICKHCEQVCGCCNTHFSRQCVPGDARHACSGCNSIMCSKCSQGRLKCRGCGKSYCKACANKPEAKFLECGRCGHSMCQDCNVACNHAGCAQAHRCRLCVQTQTCQHCQKTYCAEHIKSILGGIVEGCAECVAKLPAPMLSEEDIYTFGPMFRQGPYGRLRGEKNEALQKIALEGVRMSWQGSPLYDAQPAAAGD
jgi:hypothetical protein